VKDEMKESGYIILIGLLILLSSIFYTLNSNNKNNGSKILSAVVDPYDQEIMFYWKDAAGINYSNFNNLRSALENENKVLIFATNGGMFDKSFSPKGLYIENGVTYKPIDRTKSGYGNFYFQPNGIFFLTLDGKPAISTTENFTPNENVKYATQSGPMLLIDREIHPKFKNNSNNTYIRNGVGILPNGNILFAMSKDEINFYEFASFFKHSGCQTALYLDGYVSKAYLPDKNWNQLDGSFGVIIGVTRK
jgi:uncharacterized protein YigE (DUF2233 family)